MRVREVGRSFGSYGSFGSSRDLHDERPFVDLFQEHEEMLISSSMFVQLLDKCIVEKDLAAGRETHSLIVRSGLESDTVLGSYLIRMFSSFSCLVEAKQVFSKLFKPNVYSWSAVITAHAKLGQEEQAINLYHRMQMSDVVPDGHVFVAVLKACSSIGALNQGKQIHRHILEYGHESDAFIGSTLIDMYVKCGSLKDARAVFEKILIQDLVIWSALITGYVQHKHGGEALQLFHQMQQKGMKADAVTFACGVQACSSIAAIEEGKSIHTCIIESGFESDLFVASTLIDMYGKYGGLDDARAVFNKLPKQNVVTWSALISGYVQQDHGQEAIQLLEQMQVEGIKPNQATYVSILKACSSIAALEHGRQMHIQIVGNGFSSDTNVGNTLIDMYGNCGSLDDARRVFDRLPDRNVVTWSALIAGYSLDNNYFLALRCFEGMQRAGLRPDDVAFLSLLSACSHMDLVDKGCVHFKSMTVEHGLAPRIEHYNCMVDLLGRAACLREAEELLEIIPFKPDIVGWTSLLGSCRTHCNVDLGRRCFNHIIAMDRGNAAGYVLMSNIYVHAGMQNEVEQLEELRKCANGWKKPGRAFIEVDNQVHNFIVGDKQHPQSDDIYAKIKSLSLQMQKEGYRPSLDLVLNAMSDVEKEDALCGHCEKLAIAFGLISTPQGTTIRVGKNLRMCGDCHSAAKVISKIEMREIIVKDTYCLHHFQDGGCTCQDHLLTE